ARGAATVSFAVAVIAIWGTYTGHGAFVRTDRTESLVSLHVFLVSASLASLVMGAVVSERERSQQDLAAALQREQAARAEVQAATLAKDAFLAVLSHELRSPLQAMLGWTQLLKAEGIESRTVQKGLATIERNCKLQAQLVEDLLDVSRI